MKGLLPTIVSESGRHLVAIISGKHCLRGVDASTPVRTIPVTLVATNLTNVP